MCARGAAGREKARREAPRSDSSVQDATRGRRERTKREPRPDETTRDASSQVDETNMVHIEANDGAAAFYLLFVLTCFITCLTPIVVARAVQGKKPYLLAATVAAGVRRGRARRRMAPLRRCWALAPCVGASTRPRSSGPTPRRPSSRTRSSAWRGTRRNGSSGRRTGASRWRTTRTRAATRRASASSCKPTKR